MKKKPFILTLVAISLGLSAIFVTSCKKDLNVNNGLRPLSATIIIPASHTLSGVLGTGHTVRDSIRLNGGEWTLSGLVYVDSLDVLIIDAGTRVEGSVGDTSLGGIRGGGLIVTRSAKILAQGTAASPIIFTSARWDSTGVKAPRSGDWSGVAILGNAPANNNGATVEGIVGLPPANVTYGGNIAADNSGILQYVRIDYAGYAAVQDQELNGLTLAGVGSGTLIDFVEIFKANDDAIEFFGGTVNVTHLIAVDPLDDMFDTDNGFSGSINYALGLEDTTRADISWSNGFESDNDANGSSLTPITHPKYKHFTVIGLPNAAKAALATRPPSGAGVYGRAAHLRRNAEFEIDSSIFLGFSYGLSLDSALGSTNPKYFAGTSTVKHTYVHGFIKPFVTESNKTFNTAGGATHFQAFATAAGNFGYTTLSSLLYVNPFSRTAGTSAFIPLTSSPAYNAGAFAGGVNWVPSGSWVRYR
ncbi:hypothetical protein SAMN05428988_5735 [Chitinophaga sp. YR573]|uniref:hypothetical protein n=1 Tax=Chitinophaga sp. YR573 TaxID=1881040 RepID=UPI0008C075CE|nr:hypothetical protein [Chitinophaga sp. YR573]SEW44282.1 hypothetical protein SAMN05428988_5735 [Chitinophaga sp. YR573]